MTCHLLMQFDCCSQALGPASPCNISSEDCPARVLGRPFEEVPGGGGGLGVNLGPAFGGASITLHSTIGILVSLVFTRLALGLIFYNSDAS